MPALIHLFLDLENVQPSADELKRVRGAHYRLWILHGPHQKHFTADRVSAWQPLGEQVRFVQSVKAGKNALDLHVAFCIGQASEADRYAGVEGHYIVVSRDKGFDALIGYTESVNIRTGRVDTLAEALVLAKKLAGKSPTKPIARVAANSPSVKRVLEVLHDHPKNRPATEKRLRNHLASSLALEGSDPEVGRVLAELRRLKVISLDGTKVRYNLQRLAAGRGTVGSRE
jgi:hypothetical protein